MNTLFQFLIFIYLVGYFACLFSWIFSEESRGYIKDGLVKPSDIIIKSFNWLTILYITIKDIYNPTEK